MTAESSAAVRGLLGRGGQTMKPRTIAAATLAWTMAATGAAGQDAAAEQPQPPRPWTRSWTTTELLASTECMAESDEQDCFELWTGCGAIHPLVDVEDNEIGVDKAAVVNAVESRLLAARVYSADIPGAAGGLLVNIRFAGAAHNIRIGFGAFSGGFRSDLGFRSFITIPWDRGSFGAHAPAAHIMEVVRQFLDEFMNDYLRVNAPACERSER